MIFKNYATISGKKYEEYLNLDYEIDYNLKKLDEQIPYPHIEDEEERNYLLERCDDVIEILKKDKYSRQAVFTNLYENGMGKCIVLVHFFYRADKLFLNTYFRSQNMENNLEYDKQTHILMMNKVCKSLNFLPGKIFVFCANFHREIND